LPNFIRAVFCLHDASQEYHQLASLLAELKDLDCNISTVKPDWVSGQVIVDEERIQISPEDTVGLSNTQLNEQLGTWLSCPGYLRINLEWKVNTENYAAFIEKKSSGSIVFGIDEQAFLSSRRVSFVPGHSGAGTFGEYKRLITQFILQLRPRLGLIDYDCDYLCNAEGLHQRRASWGNYLPNTLLNRWAGDDISQLHHIADEFHQIEELGVLIFIHPLMANQNWTVRHEQLESLMNNYP
jgi:hypothetical protein